MREDSGAFRRVWLTGRTQIPVMAQFHLLVPSKVDRREEWKGRDNKNGLVLGVRYVFQRKAGKAIRTSARSDQDLLCEPLAWAGYLVPITPHSHPRGPPHSPVLPHLHALGSQRLPTTFKALCCGAGKITHLRKFSTSGQRRGGHWRQWLWLWGVSSLTQSLASSLATVQAYRAAQEAHPTAPADPETW